MFDIIKKYWHTSRHLRPVQIYGRLLFRLKRPRVDDRGPPLRRVAIGRWTPPARRRMSMIGKRKFNFLNEHGDLDQMGWDNPQVEKLWRYNLHYFDDLNALNASARNVWHLAIIADWLDQNPPATGSGWEPYPLSLRVVNWIKWACSGGVLPEPALASLAIQVRWLTKRLERHLLGNHLFANAKALIFAGSFYEGTEAESWLDLGFKILETEVPEQILGDGGQFELTPMYHSLAVEDVLDLINILAYYKSANSPKHLAQVNDLERRAPQMVRWLRIMSHPDGEISFFNDAAIGVAPSPKEIFGYASRLGFPEDTQLRSMEWLEQSGYVRVTECSAVLIADVGSIGPDYLPAHAHADTLSFELSLHERRVIVNSGTSLYGVSEERLRQRGTAAHSTLMMDNLNSSEVWSGFRVAQRAKPFKVHLSEENRRLELSASHDGYARMDTSIVHIRSWIMEHGRLEINDRVEGSGYHSIEIQYFLSPEIEVKRLSDIEVLLLDGETSKEIAVVRAEFGAKIAIKQTTWHPQFGLSLPNICLRIAIQTELPFAHTTNLSWS